MKEKENPFKDDWKARSNYLWAKRKRSIEKAYPMFERWLEEFREYKKQHGK